MRGVSLRLDDTCVARAQPLVRSRDHTGSLHFCGIHIEVTASDDDYVEPQMVTDCNDDDGNDEDVGVGWDEECFSLFIRRIADKMHLLQSLPDRAVSLPAILQPLLSHPEPLRACAWWRCLEGASF